MNPEPYTGLINLHLPLNETPEAYWEVSRKSYIRV